MATQLELVQRDLKDHARSLTELTVAIMEMKKTLTEFVVDKAVAKVEHQSDEEALERRLSRIEKALARIHTLGWWLLGTFGASIIIAAANFVLKGGLTITTITSQQ